LGSRWSTVRLLGAWVWPEPPRRGLEPTAPTRPDQSPRPPPCAPDSACAVVPPTPRKLRSDTRHDTRTLGHLDRQTTCQCPLGVFRRRPSRGRTPTGRSLAHSAIAVNVRAPAGTAQTSSAGTVTRLCRTPRRALGSSTAPNALADRRAPGQNQRPPNRNGQRRQRSAKINKRTRRSLQ
jgi:hypothetical protein